MTVLDALYDFSDEQNIASGTLSSGTTIASEDTMDEGADRKDAFGTTEYDARIGSQAKAPVVVVSVGATAFTGAGAKVIVKIQSKAADRNIHSGGTEHARVEFPALSAVKTTKHLPVPVTGMNRYWGVTYTASGGNLATGTMNAYLAEAPEVID